MTPDDGFRLGLVTPIDCFEQGVVLAGKLRRLSPW
jgi:hypothetical protein